MITSNIATNQNVSQVGQKVHYKLDKVKGAPSTKCKEHGWDKINKDHFIFSKLQTSKLGINAAAKSIRISDRAMEKIDTYIDRMKDELQVHVKNYPPFLSGSKERIEVSNNFNAFRKLIDQLTFPAEDKTAGKIMAESSFFKSEDTDIVVEHKGFSKLIHSRQVHTGPQGLDIPELSGHATDDDIELMMKKLDFAKNTLIERRAGLSEDASGIMNPPED